MKATALGIWYQKIPSGVVVNPLGDIVEPKEHNGSKYVVINRKMVVISNPKIPKLDYKAVRAFKEIFCEP